uniref:Uncharacterized protein n=1 Tax=Pyrodinium bahamense TaxID=73915 RepID=A0A7S0A646_9DINO
MEDRPTAVQHPRQASHDVAQPLRLGQWYGARPQMEQQPRQHQVHGQALQQVVYGQAQQARHWQQLQQQVHQRPQVQQLQQQQQQWQQHAHMQQMHQMLAQLQPRQGAAAGGLQAPSAQQAPPAQPPQQPLWPPPRPLQHQAPSLRPQLLHGEASLPQRFPSSVPPVVQRMSSADSAKLAFDALAASDKSTAASLFSGRTQGGAESEGGVSVSLPGVSRRASVETVGSQRSVEEAMDLAATAEALVQTRRDFWDPTMGTRQSSLDCLESASQDTLLSEALTAGLEGLPAGTPAGTPVQGSVLQHKTLLRQRSPSVGAPGNTAARARSRSLSQGCVPSAASPQESKPVQRVQAEAPTGDGATQVPRVAAEDGEPLQVLWAGARVERRSSGAKLDGEVAECFRATVCKEKRDEDARGRRFSTRSPPPPRCRSPEEPAHGRCSPERQVAAEWRASLCQEKGAAPGEGSPEFVVPRPRPSRSASRLRRRSESPAVPATPEGGVSRRARSLSVAVFGPVAGWPGRRREPKAEGLKASEHLDATGCLHVCFAERAPAAPVPATAGGRVRRQYIREVVDAMGQRRVCLTEGSQQVQPRSGAGARPLSAARCGRDATGGLWRAPPEASHGSQASQSKPSSVPGTPSGHGQS